MIKKSFSYIGISFLTFLSLLPLPLLYLLAKLSYFVIYYIFGYRRTVVRNNLKLSFPEKSCEEILAIEKDYFRYLCNLIFEIIKLSSISDAELKKRVRFNNPELIYKYLDNGQSILACTGHYGNWEMGMMALGLFIPGNAYVIYKPINNGLFNKWFYNWRTRTGNRFIPMRQTLRSVLSTRDEVTMFCFAGDQTPGKDDAKDYINFLNQQTAVLSGVEKIARQTGRPVIYFDMQVIRRGFYEVNCHLLTAQPKKTEVKEITERSFSFLENIIKDKPAYWLWSHRRWKYQPQISG